MKRSWIIAALCLSALTMSGCDSQPQEIEAPHQTTQAQEQSPAPAPEQSPDTAAAPVEVVDHYAVYPIESGIWLAKNDLGYSNYYYFDHQEQSGEYVSLDYGLGRHFSYDGSGKDLVFFMGDDAAAHPAALTTENEGDNYAADFSLAWEDGLSETLTYVNQGPLEEFHFYSNDELGQMALKQFSQTVEVAPALYATMTNEDNTVTVQLYDNLGDHNSTSAWYILDRFTAVGTDLLTGNQVSLLPQEEVPEEEQPAEGEIPAEDEPPADGEASELPVEEEVPGEEVSAEAPADADPPAEVPPTEEDPAETLA